MITEKIEHYWRQFASATGLTGVKYFDVSEYGDSKKKSDELAALIASGVKTANSSAVGLYEPDEVVPKVGDYNIILDGSGSPVCVTKTELVETVPFNQVSAEHAYHDGEGDRSLKSWRKAHINFFQHEYAEEGRQFNEQVPCLCEIFKVVYK
ncbi:ASCH domain-containing protein [Lactobacillus sp. Sy-1]|uniref:ASCH domain-containing protein n=1 Tax=Lactobacillus sp. Sy-1 TaxID=2109645 RepID=UPI001C59D3CA|nr:ASCH domain-containing protein [Lactobacillus sp. Sy-1]MBW1604960.1 ASCH domain-containing protein [Lactobacillus sp. Sy-1]